jgi:hypothetical protein
MQIKIGKKRYLFVPILANLTLSINIERVMTGSEVIEFAGSLDDFLDPGVTKLDHISGIHVDQVIMLHAPIGLFKLGDILTELMFDHQAAIQQQLDGVIQCGSADPVILILHKDIERLYIKVAVP